MSIFFLSIVDSLEIYIFVPLLRFLSSKLDGGYSNGRFLTFSSEDGTKSMIFKEPSAGSQFRRYAQNYVFSFLRKEVVSIGKTKMKIVEMKRTKLFSFRKIVIIVVH